MSEFVFLSIKMEGEIVEKRKNFEVIDEFDHRGTAKSRLKKIQRYEAKIAWKKQNRKAEKERRKCRAKSDHSETKKEKHLKVKQRLLEVQNSSDEADCLKVCIDVQYENSMSNKELVNLALQLCRTYGLNKSAERPARITLANFIESGNIHKVCVAKNDGFDNYFWNRSVKSVSELFPVEKIVYLSPDASNTLENIEKGKVYVIGGLVDSCIKKNASLEYCKKSSLNTARLPIAEYCVKTSNGTYKQVLAINQVFEILLKYYRSKSWPDAFAKSLPKRTGLVANLRESRPKSDE